MMKNEGLLKFSMHYHTQLWKSHNGRDPKYNFGVWISRQWYWYDNWVNEVKDYCIKNKFQYWYGDWDGTKILKTSYNQ